MWKRNCTKYEKKKKPLAEHVDTIFPPTIINCFIWFKLSCV